MPALEFKGKSHIYAHHLTVPYRPLQVDPARSMTAEGQSAAALTDQNLIIHGDNLQALKALLPHYGGRVKCIYIDPPYNTGNEKWVYNDRVNSPLMQDWLKKNSPVDGEDLERHDKWLCMMWPRLQLLKELLADDGAIFVSIDDNEVHHLRMLMDEIFGEENFVAKFIWMKKKVVQNDARFASTNHEFILCYRKTDAFQKFNTVPRTEEANSRYKNPDQDKRGPWQSVALHAKSGTPDRLYTITFPNGISWHPPSGTFPKFTKERLLEIYNEKRLYFGKHGNNKPRLKKYLSDVKQGLVSNSILTPDVVGSTQTATELLKRIMGDNVFQSPKAVGLIRRMLQLSTPRTSVLHQSSDDIAIVLDSFAGSGTTAHAVLAQNKEDGGSRRFILIECEDYADTITAERVRRVIQGVPNAKDQQLREGLGGSFAYCTLGDPLDIDCLLKGQNLPSFSDLAAYLLYTATGISASSHDLISNSAAGRFYADDKRDYYLIYEPKLEFLRAAALNQERARRIHKRGRPAMVFAPAKYIGQRQLSEWDITFCQLPYELMAKAGG